MGGQPWHHGWGWGSARAQMPWQSEDGQRVGGIRLWSWCLLPERRFLSSGYSCYTITQGQVPGSTEAGDKLLIVTRHLMSQTGRGSEVAGLVTATTSQRLLCSLGQQRNGLELSLEGKRHHWMANS